LFDLARPALKVFEVFLPVDAEVPSDSRSVHSPVSYSDVEARFDEQRGIDFRKVLGEAERLGAAHGVLDGLRSTVQGQLNSLYQSWTGAAANASYEHFSREIDPRVGELLPFLRGGSVVVVDAVGRVFEACRLKAEQVLGLYQEVVGSATPEVAAKVVRLANGDFNSQDEVLEVAAWVDSVCGSDLERRIRADDCGLNEGNKSYTVSQCKKWIRESFNVELYGDGGAMGLYLRFEQVCDDTVAAVDQAWEAVNEYFAGYVNEFPEPGVAQPPAPGAGGGGGSGSAAVPLPPAAPVPPPGSGGAGGGGAPGDAPGESSPDQNATPPTDPSALTGQPETISMLDPASRSSESMLDPASRSSESMLDPASRSSTTITDGDRKISVTSPDGQGQVTVTVDDGTGTPPAYTLDFAEPVTPMQVTAPQGAQGQFGNGSSAGGFGGTLDGGPAGSAGAPRPEYVATPPNAGIPGEASLASAQDQPAGPVHPPGQPGAMGGSGLPMLGGVGAGSSAQDQEHGPGQFGVAGGLAEDLLAGSSIDSEDLLAGSSIDAEDLLAGSSIDSDSDFETDERPGAGGSTFRITGSLDDEGP
jgi:hypothetical protein